MAAPEIRLSVGLDLEFFRGQMRKAVNIAQSEFTAQLAVKINRNTLNTELNNLQKSIQRRKYRIDINTNLEAEIKAADRLVTALGKVQNAAGAAKGGLPVGVKGLGIAKPKGGGFSVREIKVLFNAAVKGGLLDEKTLGNTRAQMVTALGAIGRDSMAGLLNGLKSANNDIKNTSTLLANDLIDAFKKTLGIASPSREFRKIGKNVGEGFQQGAVSSMNTAFDALESLMKVRMKVLDTFARGLFGVVGIDPAMLRAQQAESRKLRAVNWSATAPPQQRPPIGPSSSGRLLGAAAGPAGLIGGNAGPFGLLPRTTAKGSLQDVMRMLPEKQNFVGGPSALALSAEKLKSRVDAILQEYFRTIAVKVSEVFDSPSQLKKQLNVFSYLAQSLKEAEQRTKESKVQETVAALINALEGMAKDATLQAKAARIRATKVFDLGNIQQRRLPPQQIAGMLPAGVGREPQRYATGAVGGESRQAMMTRRTAEAYARSAFRSMDVMGGGAGRPASPYSYAYRGARPQGAIVPYAKPGAIVPAEAQARGGTAMPAGRVEGRGIGGLNIPNLPGAGLVKEIGTEFGFAAKQVLLFGTAYKALAFLTGFPQQVMDAVASLQSFRNTLNAISPTAAEAAASNQFILDTVQKYNIPLVSARDGFTKLYASMKPAGFNADQINNLYLGISKASATLGLSSDKVDRVTYAFAQMASKGQLMSEEVSGQLGDVIPGALSIMAEAANMDIKTFKKAMEDGVFVGKAFETVMSNVPIVLEKRFGKGAEGAAKTFQGAMNNMQTSLVLLYQSFEPIAIGFLNSVVTPMTTGIKTITDGFNAFFSGQAAQTAQGNAFAKQLNELKPTFDGITANIKALIPSFQLFGSVLLNAAKVLATIAGNPITGFLVKVYANVLLVNAAFSLLGGRILIGLITNISASIGRFIALNVAMASLQRTTAATNSTLAGSQLQMQLLNRNAILPLVTSLGRLAAFAAIAIAVTITINGREELDEVQRRIDKLKAEKNPVGPAGPVPIPTAARNYAGATREKVRADQQKQLDYVAKLRKDLKGLEKAFELGLAPEIASKKIELLRLQIAKAEDVLNLNPQKFKTAAEQQRTAALAPIPSGGEKEGDAAKAAAKLEAYKSLQDELAKNFTQDELDRIDILYQARVDKINAEFNLREAGANSLQKEAIRYERQISDIQLRREKALNDARGEVLKAQGSIAGGALVNGISTTGVTGLLQGSTGVSSGAHFDVRRQGGGHISPDQARALFDASVRKQLTLTSTYGPRRAPVPGASTFHRGVDLAGPANTPLNLAAGYTMTGSGEKGGLGYVASVRGPQGEMYDVGHLQRPGAGARPPGKVLASEKRGDIAEQKTQLAVALQSVLVQIADAKAIRDAAVAWEEYKTSILPIEEQRLQNSLLAKKNELVRTGLPDDVIEKQMRQFEIEQKVALAIENVQKQLAKKEISADLAARRIAELNAGMAVYNGLLDNNLTLQDQSKFDANIDALKKQIALASIIDPAAELRARIQQENPKYSTSQVEEQAAMQERLSRLETAKERIKSIATSISDAFGTAFKGMIAGSMTAQQALANFFQSIADSFTDMAAKMIAEWVKVQAVKGITSILSMLNPGAALGAAAGGFSSNAAGFGGGFDSGIASLPNVPNYSGFLAANGAVWKGGFQAFADGGIVKGPTLGLVGEGRYNEAVVPLPDGKSIPVDLSGMGGSTGGGISTNIVINVNNGQAQSSSSGGASDLGRKMEGAVKQVIVNELRPGGLLGGGRR